ncbi:MULTISPECIES: hypothetical protein [Lysinibacillus]|uniref:hypothetical protein n=1 Tax=Lysinibacillus TaxID=400634 RepID=UPI00214BA012|nr:MULTISPECIES: hypothetical protein [Lysinibacillus]UNT53853.1 hypothetical protein ICJ70_15090 [Lysinibacillus capsici]UUV26530.1 hypothetical protein NP781_08045 [Lysinibacillus sp. FN11]UYB49411.1 hypothetical protein OCI51_10760 [Lysinibacillus capsici]
MKIFYHCFIMWIPFIVLFALAGFGLEVLEGRKIRTSEYMTGFRDLGVGYMFLMGSFAFILYPISFLPLTFIVNRFMKNGLFKVVPFTLFGGAIGAFSLTIIYDSRFIEEYNVSIVNSMLIFGIAGFLYALVENAVKKNIKFV